MSEEATTTMNESGYRDDDLVYVDPDKGCVVGIVQWDNAGRPKTLEVPQLDASERRDGGRRRRKFFPWGTYRSMKKFFRLEGKVHAEPPTSDLDAVITKALEQPYWD